MMESDYRGAARMAGNPPDWLFGLMSRWYGLLRAHRIVLAFVLLILGALLFAASNNIVWQTSLLSFFSAHSATIRDARLSADRNGLADAMRLDIHFADNRPGDLRAAVQLLGQALQKTGQFSTVWYGASESRQLQSQLALRNVVPILLSHQQLNILRRRLSSSWLDRHFHTQVQKIAGPDGQMIAAQLQYDPLDMEQLLRSRLISPGPGSGAHFSGPLLVSGNSHHAMIILAPPFKPENVAASEKMLAVIRAAIAGVRMKMPALRVWMVGPYRNFVENQRLVKRDLKIISFVGTLLVAGVIALYFRRVGSVVVCMIPPMVGLGTALGMAGIFRLHIPLIVLGFDGLLCGATTDYGIQLMAAMNRMVRRAGRFEYDMPTRAARELFGPISMSVCTSMTGYGALAASSAPGLQTLGLFIAGATGCIWLVTFLILPACLGPWVCPTADREDANHADEPFRGNSTPLKARNEPLCSPIAPESNGKTITDMGANSRVMPPCHPRNPQTSSHGLTQWPHPGLLKILATSVFILVTLWLASRAITVGYTTNGRSLDGSTAALQHDEAMFSKVWGHLRQSGVITLHQASASLALSDLQKLDRRLAMLKKKHLIAGYSTPSAILPDARTARRRWAAWRALWNPQQIARAKTLLAHAAARNAMRASAFDAALKSWQSPGPPETALSRLQESPATLFPGVVQIFPHDIAISSTVQLNTSLSPKLATLWAADVRHAIPGVSIICGQVLYLNASRHARMEAKKLFPWVALLILIPMWIYFRRLDVAAIAALSLGIGFIWLLGVAQCWGGGLNLLSLVPILFTMGVAVDYGIYAASDPALRRGDGECGNRNSATFLCAATTILGTAAMILAEHPVLHWIGITLTAGILGGYLASYFIVGPLVSIVLNVSAGAGNRRIHRIAVTVWRVVVLLAIAFLLIGIVSGCCSVPVPPAYQPPMLALPTVAAAQSALKAFPRQWNKQFFAAMNWQGHSLSMIGQVHGAPGGTLRVTCASEFGTLLCDVRLDGAGVHILHQAADFPESLARNMGEDTALALRLPLETVVPVHGVKRGHHTLIFTHHYVTYTFAGPEGYLRVCHIRRGRENITIRYQHYTDRVLPRKVLIWDAGHCLLLTINFNAN